MSKGKKRRPQNPPPARKPARKRRNTRYWGIIAALVVLGAGGFGWLAWTQSAGDDFDSLVTRGQATLAQVRAFPNLGRDHVDPGTIVAAGEPFPLSGPHWPEPAAPGFYQEPPPTGMLIHSLEHGHVVVYYDVPGAQAIEILRRWTERFDEPWSGLVVVPREGLRDDLVVTAWRHRLDLPVFDPAALAAFIDAYRGRGPEHPVR